jgi:ElaB/YqjD/DUF883 family membrane-anchored ribosome-binding protein
MSGWVEAFIVIAAIAIVMQMAILLALFLQVRVAIQNFTQIATQLQARIDPILLRTSRILEDSESRISSIMGDAAEFTHLARTQAQKVDRVFTDTLERLRVQIVRADHILTGALEVIEETGTTVREKLWQPLNQASAVIKGIKAGLDYFRGQKRQSEPDPASQDQELFI